MSRKIHFLIYVRMTLKWNILSKMELTEQVLQLDIGRSRETFFTGTKLPVILKMTPYQGYLIWGKFNVTKTYIHVLNHNNKCDNMVCTTKIHIQFT
jgi:hypothetical protein